MSKDLPSIEDFANNNNLPSVNEFITEKIDEQLPSIDDYIEKDEVDLNEESINVSGDFNGTLVVSDSKDSENQSEGYLITKILELISEVRKDIPEIPEIKYYDEELERLCEIVDQVRSEIPEVKCYEEDIERLEKNIQDVKDQIPTFPKWVNEVNEVPDFSWIGKTFSVIDDDFIKINDKIETLGETVKLDLNSIIEETEVKFFENKVEIESNIKQLDEKYQGVKDRIWKELRESSLKIWEYHKEFKDDDRKLKKQITNEYNSLKQGLEEKLKEINENSVKTDQVLLNYFEVLKEEISGLPKVKYYDEDLRHVTKDIKDLYELVETIKTEQKSLQENLLTEPPEEKESIGVTPDPLTPMDQKFATLDDLANHYRIFINRIQTQLSTMGGGGAGFIKDLDDVSFDQTTGSGKLLIYNGSQWVGISSESLGSGGSVGAGGTWQVDSVGIHTTKNVGIGTTARSDYKIYVEGDALFTGNVSVAGTVTYEDVTNVDSIGIVTARNGAIVKAGTATTALIVEGDARVVGILTIGTSSITLDGDINQVNVGTGVTLHHTNGVQVGGNTLHTSGLTLNHVTISGISTISQLDIENGLTISGVVTSSSYSLPDGLISSGVTTTTTTSESVVDSFSISEYRSAKYQIQVTTGSQYQITEIFVIHDGTTSYQTEYATVKTGVTLSTFGSDIDSGNIRLLATPTSIDSTTFKIIRTTIDS